jgi:hypothetical protein
VRFVHPESSCLELSKFLKFKMTNGAQAYMAAFKELLDVIGPRNLQENIFLFTEGLPTWIREIVSSNLDN